MMLIAGICIGFVIALPIVGLYAICELSEYRQ